MRADETAEFLKDGGKILGVFPAESFAQYQTHLGEGDILVVYSDGITEACSSEDDEFDLERPAATVREHRSQNADEIADAVLAGIREWTAGCPPADDMTVVVARNVAVTAPPG